jgi:hypothetical protein
MQPLSGMSRLAGKDTERLPQEWAGSYKLSLSLSSGRKPVKVQGLSLPRTDGGTILDDV